MLPEGRPITIDEAVDLKLLLFGNLTGLFDTSWTDQSFRQRTVPPYGFKQKGPGPCGVLAAVQAYVILELFFGESPATSNLSKMQKDKALVCALAKILWKAGNCESAIFCIRQDNIVLNTEEAPVILERDGTMEYLYLFLFQSLESLRDYIHNNISQMTTDDNHGCIIFLYSLLLTRRIQIIKEEMDDPNSHFIGEDGYCSQEVINLILTGRAVSNLFDDIMTLSDTTLRGIHQQSEIGLLSLHDYQGNTQVGSFYTHPQFPIWVLHGRNHYTILFAKENQFDGSSFILYHYDGMLKSHAEATYTIKPFGKKSECVKDKDFPEVVQCIFTRWPLASIEKDSSD